MESILPKLHTKVFSLVLLILGTGREFGILGPLPNAIFFQWLAAFKRCWTADQLQKRGLIHPESCPLCDQEPEDRLDVSLLGISGFVCSVRLICRDSAPNQVNLAVCSGGRD